MKILLINKFYYLAGGAERYVFDWEKLLRARGHHVSLFSMRHPKNLPCAQERFFADPVAFDLSQSAPAKLKAAAHSIWSARAAERLEALLEAEGPPDVAHLHSFMFQLTPAILAPLTARGIPIVQTNHEYAHVCVNQHFYNHRIDRICEQCLHRGRLAPLWTRCVKGSLAASAAGCAAGLAEAFFGRLRTRVSRFITPGEFMRRKFIEGGMPPERVFHIPNFVEYSAIPPSDAAGDYLLFFGRLVAHKGIHFFLDAARLAPELPCKVAGGGPLEEEVRRRISAEGIANVELLGHCEGERLWELVRGARAMVVPSQWYDPQPLVILESMAAARAVIAADLAGPAEMVEEGRTGLLVPPFAPERLAEAMRRLWEDPERAREMGRAGRRRVEALYGPDLHYERVMRLFEEATR